MKNKLLQSLLFVSVLLSSSMLNATDFKNVGVHDPSIIRTPEGMYYVIGSHMAGAKSKDLMRWTQLGRSASNQPYFSNITTELSEALAWGQTDTFWAGDYVQLANGKYYMYYCVCKGDSPQGAIGYAVADSPEGKFKDLGILRRSSGSNATIDPGTGSLIAFRGSSMPNCIDPHVFFDKSGKLWMVYGSYSGGIFILELNPEDGSIKSGQSTWGNKLTGGDHVPLEAAYILYSPETDYYYLFMSMGGLAADGGYNMRVARCKTPNGDYKDAKGNSMLNAKTNENTMYAYGLKIMGNHRFLLGEGETGAANGYVSPGHNSAYYDSISGNYYLIFHSRFPEKGEAHEVRVHQMFMNKDGWPVVAPYRYAGEQPGIYDAEEIPGTYKLVDFGTGVSKTIIDSKEITLNANGTVTGAKTGTWLLEEDGRTFIIRLGVYTYKGFILRQIDTYTSTVKLTFTGAGTGTSSGCVWGSKVTPQTSDVSACDLELGADYMIYNYNSGFYLEVPDGSSDEGVGLQQAAFNGSKKQVFRLQPLSDGSYQLQTACSDYQTALCVEGGSTIPAKPIVTCLSSDTLTSNKKSYLKVVKGVNGTYTMRTSGAMLNAIRVSSSSVEEGARVDHYTYNKSTSSLHWIFVKVSHAEPLTSVPAISMDKEGVKIWSQNNTIAVSVADKISGIYIYDASGTLLNVSYSAEAEFMCLQTGTYMVVVEKESGKTVSVSVQL